MEYAQTNLQLYNQMRRAGYGEPDLKAVHDAYELATRLFTGKFRGSGKPLICHLVGTASVLCALRADARLLAAAVLHAAYFFGEFGDGRGGMTPDRRALVREVVGAEAEDLLARYHMMDWRPSTANALSVRREALSPGERDVLLIRLANELEDHLDLGVLFCHNASQRKDIIAASLHLCIQLAERIGEPLLAGELQRVFEEVETSEVPEALRHPQDYTYLLAPASMMSRPAVYVRAVMDRHPRLGRLMHPLETLRRKAAGGHEPSEKEPVSTAA